MKIKVIRKDYEEVLAIEAPTHKKPKKPNLFFRTLLRLVSVSDLWACHFSFRKIGMEKLSRREPCLYLMNHSCFLDPRMAIRMTYPRPLNIVVTTDGFVGKNWLMRQIGCIPTKKFVTDLGLIRDMRYTVQTLKSSVLLYPEAGYSFDGRSTTLPDSLGAFVKMLNVPVVMIRSYGAFARDPLYNNLQKRKVKVTADMTYLLSPEEIREKSAEELNVILREQFDFDAFAWQQEKGIRITERFRADGLERVLYKCPECHGEGCMTGKGTRLICSECGKEYELTEEGSLRAIEGITEFCSVPDWYAWERRCVSAEIRDNLYSMEADVDVYMMVDSKALYYVGEGTLAHNKEGFHLTGCDGRLDYTRTPIVSYTLNADFNWYEIGDVICIGDAKALYYCFPKDQRVPVAKARLATEELYRLLKK